ncbi:copper-translocating P-type ATPase [Veillonella denticariosi JCM 15641]|uniref:Cd(2+)-exporting ATPase n=1 Tax=Veillonella denticariosi JCM 15641 TaxID=1298594 RepID=A0A2S7ZAP7_9FIRM|nr:cation-translocating P-type ATPase [Veillonella denticariosi]PQL20333.1 copper-translocating P-type ATPase [Veillonella denticariosi JCM 15641]
MNRWSKLAEWFDLNREKITLVAGGIGVVFSLLGIRLGVPFDWAWFTIVLCGAPIVWGAAVAMYEDFDVKADLLVSLALIAAVAVGEVFAAAEIAFIMQLGAMLEEFTVSKAQAGIERLVKLTPTTARIVRNGKEEVMPADIVSVGDVVRVLPGEVIPVDGTIVTGDTAIDQSVMTGESMPVDKTVGDEVFSGTVNQFGAFDMTATKEGEDSSIQRMIKLVKSTDPGNAKIVSIADRWATWIVVIALLAAAGTYAVAGEIIRAVTILVVFCPCALVLATPAAIMAAISNASQRGFLVRRGSIMERLAKVNTMTFDKTGTLTNGTPEVIAVETVSDISDTELYRLVASVERKSEHPLGKAIVSGFTSRYGERFDAVDSFRVIPGKGLEASVQAQSVLAGNEAMMTLADISIADSVKNAVREHLHRGASIVYVAIDGALAGYVALADRVRRESRSVVESLHELDVMPVLLTGDHVATAKTIAKRLNVSRVIADCLPEDKMDTVAQLQREGNIVAMVGDGVNDAPALKKSDVGIAMGGIGSDIAVEAADIVLVNDNIRELPHLVALSKRMMSTIKINLSFSLILNFVAIILAMMGTLSPVWGALIHNGGSLLVVANSALLLSWAYKSSVPDDDFVLVKAARNKVLESN